MSKHHKTEQSTHFEGTRTLPHTRKSSLKLARLSSPGEGSSGNKRQWIHYYDHELNDYFFKSMENRLKSSIGTVICKNTPKLNEDLDALKQKLSTAK
jgi:hypothetical protein